MRPWVRQSNGEASWKIRNRAKTEVVNGGVVIGVEGNVGEANRGGEGCCAWP